MVCDVSSAGDQLAPNFSLGRKASVRAESRVERLSKALNMHHFFPELGRKESKGGLYLFIFSG